MPGHYETYDGAYLPVRADTGFRRILSPAVADVWPEIVPMDGWVVLAPIRRGEDSRKELVVVQATLNVSFCAAVSHPGVVGRPVTGYRTQDLQVVVDAETMPWSILGSALGADDSEILPGDIQKVLNAPPGERNEALLGVLAELLKKRT